jgi:hypothetical protein
MIPERITHPCLVHILHTSAGQCVVIASMTHKEVLLMRRFGWIGVALVLVLTVIAGVIGYDVGMNHAVETAVASGGANVTYVVAAGGGFPFFPLLFGFLLFMLVVGFIRRASWRGRHDWYAMQMRAAGRPGPVGPWSWGGRGPWCGEMHGADRTGADGTAEAPGAPTGSAPVGPASTGSAPAGPSGSGAAS